MSVTPPGSDGTWAPADPPYAPTYPPVAPPQPAPYQPADPYSTAATDAAPAYAPAPATYPYSTPPPPYAAPSVAYPAPSGYGAFPAEPPEPERRGRRVVQAIVVIVVLALCGWGSYVGGQHAGANAGASAEKKSLDGYKDAGLRVKVPARVAIGQGDNAALAKHLAVPPTGATTYTLHDAPKGYLGLKDFIGAFFDTDDPGSSDGTIDQFRTGSTEIQLRTDGFRTVVLGAWYGVDDLTVQTQLIQFESASGAKSFITWQRGSYATDSTVKQKYVIGGGTCFIVEKPALDVDGEHTAIAMCADGDVAVVIFFSTPGGYQLPEYVTDLQHQLDAIGA